MSLHTFFGYFGSKWESTPRYPKPMHATIIEPFAGGAGYSVRHHHKRVILVEKDPTIAGIWRYLLRASAREILALPDLPEGGGVSDLDVPGEVRALIGHNVARGNPGAGETFTSWDLKFPHSVWGRAMRARLAAQVDKIRHWQIIEGDYTQAPDIEATWFIDPPYQCLAGRVYGCRAEQLDFAELGAWCQSRRGQVIVCENADATWLPFRPLGLVRGSYRRGGDGVSREAIWTNDPPAADRNAG